MGVVTSLPVELRPQDRRDVKGALVRFRAAEDLRRNFFVTKKYMLQYEQPTNKLTCSELLLFNWIKVPNNTHWT